MKYQRENIMNILKFFKSLITPNLEQRCDGTYDFISINCTNDIKILINQIKLIPYQTHIDTDWIIKSLKSISSDPVTVQSFINTYKQIEVGKDLKYNENI